MWAQPDVLRELIERYEHLRAQSADVRAEPRVRDLLRDTAYTLCVSTGTRDIEAALRAARAHLNGPDDDREEGLDEGDAVPTAA
jgi:hypothetical protein